MCVCVCVCVCICAVEHMHVWASLCACVCVYVCEQMHVCASLRVCVCVCVSKHMYVHSSVKGENTCVNMGECLRCVCVSLRCVCVRVSACVFWGLGVTVHWRKSQFFGEVPHFPSPSVHGCWSWNPPACSPSLSPPHAPPMDTPRRQQQPMRHRLRSP